VAFIEIKQFKKVIDKGKQSARIKWDDKQQTIFFSRVNVGYGCKVFFICSCCGENRTMLYLDSNIFKCVNCCTVKPYRGIQNTTKGGDEYLGYKMERFAIKVGIGSFDYPFDYLQHFCPKGKHKDKWNKNLSIMQALENMRTQSIFFNKIWNQKTIQSVESGKNKYLKCTLLDLKEKFIPFDNGFDIQVTHKNK